MQFYASFKISLTSKFTFEVITDKLSSNKPSFFACNSYKLYLNIEVLLK